MKSSSVLLPTIPDDDVVEVVMARLPASELCGIPDLAAAVGVANNVVRGWIDAGILPAINCGGGQRSFMKVSKNTFRQFLIMRRDGLV